MHEEWPLTLPLALGLTLVCVVWWVWNSCWCCACKGTVNAACRCCQMVAG